MKLLEALSKITQADLDECVVAIQGHEKELDQLKELRKIMEVKLGIKKPAGFHLRAGQRKKPAGGAMRLASPLSLWSTERRLSIGSGSKNT